MNRYLNEAKKVSKRFDSDDFVKSAAVLADFAQSFMNETRTEIANDGIKYAKKKGRKGLREIERYVGLHPTRNYVYALGAGALLSYLLIPRK